MKAAIYTGNLTENIEPLKSSCPTGNSTWPITPSMAVCRGCTKSTYQTACNSTDCNYIMPSGSIVIFSTLNDGTTNVCGFQVVPGHGAVYNTSDKHRIWLANFDVFGAPYYTQTEGYLESLPNENPIASECALWMCAYRLSKLILSTRIRYRRSSRRSPKSSIPPIPGCSILRTITYFRPFLLK